MVPYIYKLVADYLEKRTKRNKANNAAPTVVKSAPVVEPKAVEPKAVEPEAVEPKAVEPETAEPTEEIVVDEK